MPRTKCLSEAELSAFLLGEVTDIALDEIAEHLENCADCERAAQKLDNLSDTAVAALRRNSSESTFVVDESHVDSNPDRCEKIPMAADLPDFIGPYEILAQLGRGGMGVVYKARHPKLRRVVALKMMLGGRFADPHFRARFRSEAEASARMQHPHIVQIFEIGEHEGQPYFTLEFVDGGCMSELVGEPQPPHRSAKWLETLARAVDYAHGQGIVHRDLKPANILLGSRGEGVGSRDESSSDSRLPTPDSPIPKITDFGVAKLLEGSDIKTMTGMVVGTAEYMAPEQTDGQSAVGPPADVYALGAILYALLVGRPPFQSRNVLDTLEQVKSQLPTPPRKLQPKLPRDLETICLTCLEKDPRKRYTTAEALADDLHRFLGGEPIVARPVGTVERAVKWAKRCPAIAALLALVAVVSVVSAGVVAWKWQDALHQQNLAENRRIAELEAKTREAKANIVAKKAQSQTQKAIGEVKTAKKIAQKETDLRVVTKYAFDINSAQKQLDQGYVGRAEEILNGCSPHLRSWEYHYLMRLCRKRLRTVADARCGGSLEFSPDGKFLAYDTMANAIEIRDVTNLKKIRTLPGRENGIVHLAYAPSGKFVASAGKDKAIMFWDTDSGELVKTLTGHRGNITCLAFGPNAKTMVSASWSEEAPAEVIVWSIDSGKALRRLVGHTKTVASLAYSPDGVWIASGAFDNTLKIWRTATGKEVFNAPHDSGVRHVAFTAGGKKLISHDQLTIRIWKEDEGWEKPQLHQTAKMANGYFAATNGTLYAAIEQEQTVTLRETKSDKVILTVKQYPKPRKDPRTKRPLPAGNPFRCLRIGPHGKYMANISTHGVLQLWNLYDTGRARILPSLVAGVDGLDFSADGKWLVTSGEDYKIQIWNVESGEKRHTVKTLIGFTDHARFDPTGNYLVTAGSGKERALKFRDTTNWKENAAIIAHTPYVDAMAFNKDGTRLATCGQGTTKIWDMANRQVVKSLPGSGSDLAFSLDGNFLSCASNPIKIWDVRTGDEMHSLAGHKGMIKSVAFSPDGKYLASGGADNTVRLWNTATGKEICNLTNHTFWVSAVAFTPDGKRLFSASWDKTITVWDVATGLQILTLEGNMNRIRSLTISRDGKWLATGHDLGKARIW